MSTQPTITSWQWPVAGDEPAGLVLDPETGLLEWYNGLGCTCGEDLHPVVQTIADYLQRGAPGLASDPPLAVHAEILQALADLDRV